MNFNITGKEKMVKNSPYLFKFSDFLSVCAYFEGKHCLWSLHDDFDYNSRYFSQVIKKNGRGLGEQPSVCGHLDGKDVSVSNVLGALTTIERY